MAEDSEMGELVDDDRLEGLGRGEDEPPAEHEPALARRAPPAAVRVPQGDRSRIHGQRGGVTGDLGIHGDAGPLSEPRLQNAVDPLVISLDECDVELVAGLPTDPGNGRSPAPAGRDPEAMELAPISDERTIGEAAPRGELGALAGEPLEVAADPRVAAAEEGLDLRFGMGPAAARRRRDRDDEPDGRIDRDPEPARPGGSPEHVWRRRNAADGGAHEVERHRARW